MRELFDEAASQPPLDPHQAVRRSGGAPQRKRFYAQAGVSQTPDGFLVMLDGKPVRTPSRKLVAIPSRPIAEAIAVEWNAQPDVIDPVTMPLTRLANSVVEGVVDRVDDVRHDIVNYVGSDLLCYRAGHPQELVRREAAAWDPVLFWAADVLGAHFILAEGVVHVAQPERALSAARAALPHDPWLVAAVHVATTITGSALLALALLHGVRNADEVWAAAHVDEDWNVEQWGADEEVAARRAAREVDFRAAADVIAALRSARS